MQICYIVSQIDRAIAFEWICEELNQKRFQLEFILLNPGPSYLHSYLEKRGIPVRSIRMRGRKDYPLAFLKILVHLLLRRPDAVHVHLLDASLVALPAAWFARVSKRILTRHHSDYHLKFAPRFVKFDKLTTFLSTHVIAITESVRKILIQQEGAPEKKLRLLHHGFRLEHFKDVPESQVKELRSKYSIEGRHPVIGVVARYVNWKGIQYTAEAFERLLLKYPDAVLFLANARGPDASSVRASFKNIPARNLRETPFEQNLFALYHLFDAYVHVPYDPECEAFGQTYVEALASGIPSVFTLSGVAHEFIQNEKNALVVGYKDPAAIYQSLLRIIEKKIDLVAMAAEGKKSIKQFELAVMVKRLEELYEE